MFRAVIIILFASCVKSEMRSLKQSVYVSRKSRSNAAPLETGYVYSQVDSDPGSLTMFENDVAHYNSYIPGRSSHMPHVTSSYDYPSHSNKLMDKHANPSSSYNYEYEKSKAEADFDSHYLPSKMKSDAMYEKLKSIMHYKYPDSENMNDVSYDTNSDYHIDDDDVRTSSRMSYDSWPYLYHSPYDYEAVTIDSDAEKVKDKRYATGKHKDVIPVHENVDDIPNDYGIRATSRYDREVSTDNPVYGNQPFFSYVLNDYYDKNTDEDHLNFNGLDWGKEFDHGSAVPEAGNHYKRDRRLQNSYTPVSDNYFNDKTSNNYDTSRGTVVESSTEKSYNKKHDFDKHEKGDNKKENHKTAYEQNGQNYRGFKDFVDTFANKFGGEEHKKDSNYILKKEQDKGEKRKGFRRVYHKDEYQEDNEFYDNSNNSAKSEEKGSSALHNGGSEAILQSHAAAATGSDANAYNKSGNTDNSKFENNHRGHNLSKGYDNQLNKFRDVAKSAATSNGVDY